LAEGAVGDGETAAGVGQAVFEALVQRGYDAVRVFVDRDLDLALRAASIDVAFLALSGRRGRDGSVQGLLEVLGIPYTGSSVLASAIALDKLKTRELLRLHNLPTPSCYVHQRGHGSAVDQHGSFGFPAVCKPRSGTASMGVRYVEDTDDLEAAVDEALAFDDHVLIERYLEGVEVHVVLLGDEILGGVEIESRGPIFDLDARRGKGGATFYMPPRLSLERLRGATTFAARAASVVGATGLVEVDLIVSPHGNEVLLEVDTQPLLAPGSVVAHVARSTGHDLGSLAEAMLADAALHGRRRAPFDERRTQDAPFVGPERRHGAAEPH
jgi:D-alanine-D-alanine ligase